MRFMGVDYEDIDAAVRSILEASALLAGLVVFFLGGVPGGGTIRESLRWEEGRGGGKGRSRGGPDI